ncbi:MAG: hypothetical protein A2V74_00535 [Acidobacteria bacterium RBG_16_70_10]|nr:MAG: hypothetical protein A2V74_00535 [Acidobacteria bacterium RBG_16_70_10]
MERRVEDLHHSVAAEGGTTGQHLEDDGAEGEEIGPGIDRPPTHLLRGHVARSPHDHPRLRQLAPELRALGERVEPLRLTGEAEIEDLGPVRGEEDIRGLEVPVDEAARMQGLERGERLERQLHRLRQGQRSAPQPLRERLALEQLHRDEEAPFVLADLVELADVGVVDAGGDAGLAPEAPGHPLVGAGSDRLYGERPSQTLVPGREDDAHPALAKLVEEPVGADPVPGRSQRARRVLRGRTLRSWRRALCRAAEAEQAIAELLQARGDLAAHRRCERVTAPTRRGR